MSIVSQNSTNEEALVDCIQRFFSKHHIGKLLKKCNGTKEKGVPAITLLRYKLGNIFVGKSMYMQQKIGSFKEAFSKNTYYRFLNSTKTNWLRFTTLLAADIVNNDLKKLTSEERKDVFIIDDSLFNRSSCKKTELGSRVFDHVDMSYKKGYRMLTLSWSDGNTLIPVNRIYGKRWQIEIFFKTCKSMLNLIGECHSLSYDALTAHTAIVFTRYMLLALEQRQNSDQRTLGEIFFFLVDEMADITFSRSFYILMEALVASLQEILKLTDNQISAFVTDFESRLPEYLQEALHPTVSVA